MPRGQAGKPDDCGSGLAFAGETALLVKKVTELETTNDERATQTARRESMSNQRCCEQSMQVFFITEKIDHSVHTVEYPSGSQAELNGMVGTERRSGTRVRRAWVLGEFSPREPEIS